MPRVADLHGGPGLGIPIVSVGVPKPLGEAKDYYRIFSDLQAAGVAAFFPVFTYQDAPVSLTLNNYLDFLPPCSASATQFAAARSQGIKLLLPGALLYPSDLPLPTLADDPLRKLIACVGRDFVFGVQSYDEPFFGAGLAPAIALYNRVKTVDPTLLVSLTHAPILSIIIEAGVARAVTQAEITFYLQDIQRFTPYADLIGFDAYPIPQSLAHVTTPYARGAELDYQATLRDYLRWLRENGGGKPYYIAVQAFSYDNLGTPYLLASTAGALKPTRFQLETNLTIAAEENAAFVLWFGPSYLKNAADLLFWDDVKASASVFR